MLGYGWAGLKCNEPFFEKYNKNLIRSLKKLEGVVVVVVVVVLLLLLLRLKQANHSRA